MIDFSLILLSFNASEEQIERTIVSVLEQKEVSFEIIVCDDCSRDNHFIFIKELFEIHHFKDYTLLKAEKNMGTIRNVLRGLEIARGKYAKLIGMGDLLYCDTTLIEVYNFMETNLLQSCFGLIEGYRIKNGEFYKAKHNSPIDIDVYRNSDKKKIAKNLLLAEDWVSGVCIFATTKYYYKYISMMKDKVIYCEDWATALAIIDEEYLSLYDDYVVKYEVGDGVSTTPNPVWKAKLLEDNKQFWKLFETYAKEKKWEKYNKYINSIHRKKKCEKIHNSAVQFLMKGITNPYLVIFWLKAMKNKKE